MIIDDLQSQQTSGGKRISARIVWEERDHDPQRIYFETIAPHGDKLNCMPHPFLSGAVLPAFHHGEERIKVEGSVCPRLLDGIDAAQALVRHWFYQGAGRPVRVQPESVANASGGPINRSAAFFSGGIDSLALLLHNRGRYPESHPGYIHEGILIYGQNHESDDDPTTFETAARLLSTVCRDAGMALIPVHTNIRDLEDGTAFFGVSNGSILASVGHALGTGFDRIHIASSHAAQDLIPRGSHPLLDPLFSSEQLSIRHEGIADTRLEKVRKVAQWPAGLDNIKVCGPNWPGQNCCRCEKCVRTMLELLVVGALDRSAAFAVDTVSADLVQRIKLRPSNADYYAELPAPLRVYGYHDLAAEIEKKLARHFGTERGAQALLRRLDKRVLKGTLTSIRRALLRQEASPQPYDP